jgi:aspartyl/asparaginyl-tRNA synthetase
MFIYNVTTKITNAIHDDWLQWIKEEHIPDIINTGCFTNATVLQLLETDESEGPTYVVQYMAESKALYNKYIEQYAVNMRQKSIDKWGDQFIAFRSILQLIK